MRLRLWRLALVMALVFMLGFSLGGWPTPALGQDAGGDQTATAEAALAEPPITCPVLAEDGALATATPLPGSEDLTGTPALPTPEPEQETGEPGLWCAPFNVSQSGAASRPALSAEPDGTLHAVWWDEFDGTKVAYYTPEDGWSDPQTTTVITGGRAIVNGRSVRLPPTDLRLIGTSTGWVHAFWLDDNNNLRYARSRSGSGVFALGPTLAANPLAWNLTQDSDGNLHLIFIRSDNTTALPAGVYYRNTTNDGAGWLSPLDLSTSLYFRSMTGDDAYVQVVGDGHGRVMAAWDDAELRRSFYALSDDNGRTFDDPVPVEGLQDAPARHTRLFAVGEQGGEFLRMWQVGDSCALYQQIAVVAPPLAEETPAPGAEATATPLPTGPAWSDPVRVFDTLSGCLTNSLQFQLPDNRTLAVLAGESRPLLTTWDGLRWSDPLGLQISFVEQTINRPISLECLNIASTGRQMAVMGCDQFGDVWVTTSRVSPTDLLPALTTAWSAPHILSGDTGDASLPSASVDSQGQVYALWSQSPDTGVPGTVLLHTSGDGIDWPDPVEVLRSPEGQAEQPVVAAGPGGLLHAVWSGGYTGQIYYSQAFVRDARIPSGWKNVRELPAPRSVGGWPDMVIDAAGTLHVVYVVPLNEDRGVYYTRSDDQGNTWSPFVRVFDGSQAGWAMVRGTRLTVDSAGHLHLVWVRAALPDAGTPLGVYYARSDDGGQTWTAPLEMGDVDSDNPRIVEAAPGEIHLAWTHVTSTGLEIIHQWSPDGGQTWATATPLLGLRRISAPDFGLTADGSGTMYLVGIERSRQESAALFYVRWDGTAWGDRESVPLGYDPAAAAGAMAVLLPQGELGVFYRVRAPVEGGGAHYVTGYLSRPVTLGQAAPVATFTPLPTASLSPDRAVGATATLLPTPDITSLEPPTVNSNVRKQIGIAMVVIVLISGLAVFRLWRGAR